MQAQDFADGRHIMDNANSLSEFFQTCRISQSVPLFCFFANLIGTQCFGRDSASDLIGHEEIPEEVRARLNRILIEIGDAFLA